MLINGKRALAYTDVVVAVEPIEGADNIEKIKVEEWILIAKKGEFKVGDRCIYFEIDSKLPEKEWCAFMAAKKFKVKPYKLNKFGVISMGLAMPITADFGVEIPEGDHVDVTELLGVTYSVDEDNKRKQETDKYTKMYLRRISLFKKYPLLKRIYETKIGKRILFFLLGRKKDRKGAFPAWIIKTDSERIQNMPYLFKDYKGKLFAATEKIHGSSCTFALEKRNLIKKGNFYVCSRNVSFEKGVREKCFYEVNHYIQMAEKYSVQSVLENLLKDRFPRATHIVLQGEIYGPGIQKRDYSIAEPDFAAFNLEIIEDGERIRILPHEIKEIFGRDGIKIPVVPLLGYIAIPKTCQELLDTAKGISMIDGKEREGIVFKDLLGTMNFKAVDAEFMMKY